MTSLGKEIKYLQEQEQPNMQYSHHTLSPHLRMRDGAEAEINCMDPRLRDGERGAEEDGETLQVVATKIGNSKRFSREDRGKAMETSDVKLLNEGLCMTCVRSNRQPRTQI